MQLARDVDALRAVFVALAASGAMVSLTQCRDCAVIADQIRTACLAVVLGFAAVCDIPFIHAFVVMQEDGRDVDAVRARHAVFAVVARYRRVGHHQLRRFLQKIEFFLVEGNKRGVGLHIVDQMFHIGHAAQDGQDTCRSPCKSERP